jgi:hypothetical protein
MALFKNLFGPRCASCGLKILEGQDLINELSHETVEITRRLIMLRAVAFMCNQCNSKICLFCTGKTDEKWKNFPNCPKCGSEMKKIL